MVGSDLCWAFLSRTFVGPSLLPLRVNQTGASACDLGMEGSDLRSGRSGRKRSLLSFFCLKLSLDHPYCLSG